MTLAGVPEPRRCCSASRRPRRCSSACRLPSEPRRCCSACRGRPGAATMLLSLSPASTMLLSLSAAPQPVLPHRNHDPALARTAGKPSHRKNTPQRHVGGGGRAENTRGNTHRENHRSGKTHRRGALGGKQPFHTTLFGVCTPDIGRGASACRERATRTTKNRGVIDCIMIEICADHD